MVIGIGPSVNGVNGRPKKPVKPTKHDNLCITVTSEYGMSYCWCNCPDCWHKEGVVRNTRKPRNQEEREEMQVNASTKGRCICRACPCHDPVYLLPTLGVFTAAAERATITSG